MKNWLYLIPIVLVLFAGFTVISKNSSQISAKATTYGNFQIVEVFAKNGYTPSITEAKAGVPTILKVVTKNTLDCSAALFIPSIKYQKYLPMTGETEIQLLPQKSGTTVTASCSMGMFGFEIRFV